MTSVTLLLVRVSTLCGRSNGMVRFVPVLLNIPKGPARFVLVCLFGFCSILSRVSDRSRVTKCCADLNSFTLPLAVLNYDYYEDEIEFNMF